VQRQNKKRESGPACRWGVSRKGSRREPYTPVPPEKGEPERLIGEKKGGRERAHANVQHECNPWHELDLTYGKGKNREGLRTLHRKGGTLHWLWGEGPRCSCTKKKEGGERFSAQSEGKGERKDKQGLSGRHAEQLARLLQKGKGKIIRPYWGKRERKKKDLDQHLSSTPGKKESLREEKLPCPQERKR